MNLASELGQRRQAGCCNICGCQHFASVVVGNQDETRGRHPDCRNDYVAWFHPLSVEVCCEQLFTKCLLVGDVLFVRPACDDDYSATLSEGKAYTGFGSTNECPGRVSFSIQAGLN